MYYGYEVFVYFLHIILFVNCLRFIHEIKFDYTSSSILNANSFVSLSLINLLDSKTI